jgi:hypothetical protein
MHERTLQNVSKVHVGKVHSVIIRESIGIYCTEVLLSLDLHHDIVTEEMPEV